MILKKRPTVDFVFMIPVALKASKRKHNTISLAFIEKAYDKVCRELLYTKLRNIGFGVKVESLIRSMYFNDCVSTRIIRSNLFHTRDETRL